VPLSRRRLFQAAAAGALLVGCAADRGARTTALARGRAEHSLARGAAAPPAAAPAWQAALPSGLPDQIGHGRRDRPLVALTLYGQGDPDVVESLLAASERAGARLTVLAAGNWLDQFPAMARRVLDGGHELGNHTWSCGDLNGMAPEDAGAEIEDCAEVLRSLTGSIGRWFRPSQARLATPLVVSIARQAGYAHLLSYDVDPLDAALGGTPPPASPRPTPAKSTEARARHAGHDGAEHPEHAAGTPGGAPSPARTPQASPQASPAPEDDPAPVRAAVARQTWPGSVVALRPDHPGTAAALPHILADLRARGLRPVTASELLV